MNYLSLCRAAGAWRGESAPDVSTAISQWSSSPVRTDWSQRGKDPVALEAAGGAALLRRRTVGLTQLCGRQDRPVLPVPAPTSSSVGPGSADLPLTGHLDEPWMTMRRAWPQRGPLGLPHLFPMQESTGKKLLLGEQ